MRRIWVAKATHDGGAFGSKRPILEALIDSSRDIGTRLVSTEHGMGPVHQKPSHSLESSSLPLPPSSPTQASGQGSEMAFQRVDPRPFALPGFHHQEVHHKATMVCVVMRPS
jgi:hypothetical protein